MPDLFMPPPALELAADAPDLLTRYREWWIDCASARSTNQTLRQASIYSAPLQDLDRDVGELRRVAGWAGPGPGPILVLDGRPIGRNGTTGASRGQIRASIPPPPRNALTEAHSPDETWQLARTVLLAGLLAAQANQAAEISTARVADRLRLEALELGEIAAAAADRLPASSSPWLGQWRDQVEAQNQKSTSRPRMRPASLRT